MKLLDDKDVHSHLMKRMKQRGVSLDEINAVLENGIDVNDAKPGTFGKKFISNYNKYQNNNFYKEKEVRVYYKFDENELIILTSIARYGNNFSEES